MALALGKLDSEGNTQDNHRPISAVLCICYLALQTAVVDRLTCGVVGNRRLCCGDFRPEKSENVEAGTREESEDVEDGTRLAYCRWLRSAHWPKPRRRWSPQGDPYLLIQSA